MPWRLTPGYIIGRIFLKGPPETGTNSMLRFVKRASDSPFTQNGVPAPGFGFNQDFFSYLTVSGVNRRAPGATYTAANGQTNACFPGCREDFKGGQKRASKGGQSYWARILEPWRRPMAALPGPSG